MNSFKIKVCFNRNCLSQSLCPLLSPLGLGLKSFLQYLIVLSLFLCNFARMQI